MKLLPLILLLTISTCWSQKSEKPIVHSLAYSPFRFELNSVTINQKFEPKFVNSIDYSVFIKNFGIVTRLEYGENLINDNCNSCADHLYGEGRMKELNSELGLKFQLGRVKNWRIQPNINLLGYFSNLNYKGDFEGGFWGGGTTFDTRYQTFGFKLETGLTFKIAEQFDLELSNSCQFGSGTYRANINGATTPYTTGSVILSRIGLRYFL